MDGAPPTVGDALERACRLGLDRLDAQLIVAARLGRDRAWVIAHPEAALDDSRGVTQWLARRAAGEPLAYLLGRKEFHGLDLCVGPAVLVPRPDTETLVDWALELLQAHHPADPPERVADLGTGSGAIALALAAARPDLQVTATDLSRSALEVARANAQRLGLAIDFRDGDWWTAVGEERFDLVVANPPYIAQSDPHLDALAHEPQLALISGADGLDAIERIVALAPRHLQPGGWLLLEHGHDQGARVAALMTQAGFDVVQARRDLAGIVRCTGGVCRSQGGSNRENRELAPPAGPHAASRGSKTASERFRHAPIRRRIDHPWCRTDEHLGSTAWPRNGRASCTRNGSSGWPWCWARHPH